MSLGCGGPELAEGMLLIDFGKALREKYFHLYTYILLKW